MKDIAIIGSGPAGLSSALYAKRANLNVVVIEKEFLGTGQIAESAQVDNYLGLCGISGYDLGEKFRHDAESFGAEFLEGEAVSLEQKNNVWIITLQSGEVIKSKAVIYAAGAAHRRLNVKGEEKFIGKGVSYCAICDGALYRGRTLAVIGGDTALDDAMYLSDTAKKVYLIHRRNEFRGLEKSIFKIKSRENIEIITPANVTEIIGENRVSSIKLDNGREIILDGVFIAVGMSPASDLVRNIVDLDENGYIKADETGVTRARGLFCAGDVRTKKLRQVITAASDGANAAIGAIEYLKSSS